jgi:hypothetical protein
MYNFTLVIGWTVFLSACGFLATHLVPQAGLVVTIKFTFFNQQHHQADTATNSQPAAMLKVVRHATEHSNKTNN